MRSRSSARSGAGSSPHASPGPVRRGEPSFPMHGTSQALVAGIRAPGNATDVPSADLHRQLADELWDADRTAKPIAALTDRHDGLAIEDAYAIQTINIDRR